AGTVLGSVCSAHAGHTRRAASGGGAERKRRHNPAGAPMLPGLRRSARKKTCRGRLFCFWARGAC
ncbi:hypothetical protein CR199_14845, partial [Enterococcus faecium]